MKIEKGKVRKPKGTETKGKYPFDEMSPGDSFYFEGPRTSPIQSFGYRATKGCFSIQKEGKGYRFFLLRDPLKPKGKDS